MKEWEGSRASANHELAAHAAPSRRPDTGELPNDKDSTMGRGMSQVGEATPDLADRLRDARVGAFLRRRADGVEPASPDTVGENDRTDSPNLERLVALAGQVYSAAVTEQTRDSYARRWAEFTDWCKDSGLPSLPATTEVLMMYLTHGANLGGSVNTLRGRAAAINRIHIEAGETPPGDDPAATLFWRGLARTLPGTRALQITALRIENLRDICRVIDAHAIDPVEVRDRAILGLHSLEISDAAIARLDWADIRLTPAQAVVRIPSCGSAGQPKAVRIRRAQPATPACPLTALRAWHEFNLHRRADLAGPVFWQFDARFPLGGPLTNRAVGRVRVNRLMRLGDGEAPATTERAMALLGGRHPIDLRDKAILTLGFAGAMRRGEITDLRWSDLHLRDGGLVCRLRRTKTDMGGKHNTEVGIPYGRTALTCPVTAVLAWKERVEAQFGPVDPEGWVFTTAGKRGRSESIGREPITREAITHMVRRRAQTAGLDGHWGGRSLRAGFISTAADLDIPLETIATQSRHKTLNTLARYIRHSDPFRRNPAARVGL